MKHVMIWLVRLYQKYISPLKPPCCRFKPTCSAYAIEAFRKRGFFIGFILTVWRILRCNPFSKGGYDPVPEKGLRPPKNAKPPIEWQDTACECGHAHDTHPKEGEEVAGSADECGGGDITASSDTNG